MITSQDEDQDMYVNWFNGIVETEKRRSSADSD